LFEIVEQYPVITELEHSPPMMHPYRPKKDKKVVAYGILILLLVVVLILGRVILPRMIDDIWILSNSFRFYIERLMIKKLTEELKKTNQRLDGIEIVSIEDMEQKLTKQVRRGKS